MSFGRAIREIRKELGLSQKSVADAADIGQSYLCMIESDERRNPGAQILARVAQALGISVDELVMRAGLLPRDRPDEPLTRKATHLFRQLPLWRQQDVLAQLEFYLTQVEIAPHEARDMAPHDETGESGNSPVSQPSRMVRAVQDS